MTNNINEELAVTKNDIKHLEADMKEIKKGVKEINENFSAHMEQIDEKYVRKEDFKDHQRRVDKRFESIKALTSMLLGCVITGLILLIVNLIMGYFK